MAPSLSSATPFILSADFSSYCRMWHPIFDRASPSQASQEPWLIWLRRCTKAEVITVKWIGGLLVLHFTNAFTTRYGLA